MKYTVIEAAKIVGITRQTIYRHIDKKPITTEKDEEGNIFIDASELIRVYGNDINFEALKNDGDSKDTSNSNKKKLQPVTKSDTSSPEIKVIEERLNSATKQIDMLETQMRRERDIMEEQIVTLKDALKTSQEVQNKTVTLLEDQRNKPTQNDAEWKDSIKALEQKIATQEKEVQEKLEKEAGEKQALLAKVTEYEAEKKDLSKANKMYAGLAILTILGILTLAAVQAGIITISF
jgi:chromosome segregation ATPase